VASSVICARQAAISASIAMIACSASTSSLVFGFEATAGSGVGSTTPFHDIGADVDAAGAASVCASAAR